MASKACFSSLSSALMRSLSSSVDFLVAVPTISMPISCKAATTDHDLTPPVLSSTRLPASPARYGSRRRQTRASWSAISASARSTSARVGALGNEKPRELAQRVGSVGDAVEGALEIGDAPTLLHLARHVDQRGRAHGTTIRYFASRARRNLYLFPGSIRSSCVFFSFRRQDGCSFLYREPRRGVFSGKVVR